MVCSRWMDTCTMEPQETSISDLTEGTVDPGQTSRGILQEGLTLWHRGGLQDPGDTGVSQMEADEALARQLQRAEMEGMGTPLIFPVGPRAPEGDEARQTRMNAFDQYVTH